LGYYVASFLTEIIPFLSPDIWHSTTKGTAKIYTKWQKCVVKDLQTAKNETSISHKKFTRNIS